MWLAHALTLARLPLAGAFGWAYGRMWIALALIGLAALTDTLDGTVARRAKARGARGPDIGGWLDPLVDKLFVVTVLGIIWYHQRDGRVIALVGARELLLLPLVGVHVARHTQARELHADPIGKAATIAQFGALAIIVAIPRWSLVAASVAGVLGVLAAAHYVRQAWRRRDRPRILPGGPGGTS